MSKPNLIYAFSHKGAFMQEYISQAISGAKIAAKGYAVADKNAKFAPYKFTLHALGERDILMEILFAGICHSDIHSARSEWGEGIYPMVPGHEIAGRVIAVGNKVSKFKVGDYAGVGCMVNSCGKCEACKASNEQFCQNTIYTYIILILFSGSWCNTAGLYQISKIKIPPCFK